MGLPERPVIACEKRIRVQSVDKRLSEARAKLERFEKMGNSCPTQAIVWVKKEIKFLSFKPELPVIVEFRAIVGPIRTGYYLNTEVHNMCASMFKTLPEPERDSEESIGTDGEVPSTDVICNDLFGADGDLPDQSKGLAEIKKEPDKDPKGSLIRLGIG